MRECRRKILSEIRDERETRTCKRRPVPLFPNGKIYVQVYTYISIYLYTSSKCECAGLCINRSRGTVVGTRSGVLSRQQFNSIDQNKGGGLRGTGRGQNNANIHSNIEKQRIVYRRRENEPRERERERYGGLHTEASFPRRCVLVFVGL